jgi:hypothetical protein
MFQGGQVASTRYPTYEAMKLRPEWGATPIEAKEDREKQVLHFAYPGGSRAPMRSVQDDTVSDRSDAELW